MSNIAWKKGTEGDKAKGVDDHKSAYELWSFSEDRVDYSGPLGGCIVGACSGNKKFSNWSWILVNFYVRNSKNYVQNMLSRNFEILKSLTSSSDDAANRSALLFRLFCLLCCLAITASACLRSSC